ncbi:hypothetical protein Rleg10DRAFT_2319 [Rhizobium leguminosarum bv. trifolii WSM2012]|nr:hypothetical protein Rleg10DRAFT_2319 [Rhizobium leguminosarum bv. trifolii WSM2012]
MTGASTGAVCRISREVPRHEHWSRSSLFARRPGAQQRPHQCRLAAVHRAVPSDKRSQHNMIDLSDHKGTSCLDDASQKQRHAGDCGRQPEEPKPQARQGDLILVVSVLGRSAHRHRAATVYARRPDSEGPLCCLLVRASSAAFSHASGPCSVMQAEDIGLGARLANEEPSQPERVAK